MKFGYNQKRSLLLLLIVFYGLLALPIMRGVLLGILEWDFLDVLNFGWIVGIATLYLAYLYYKKVI